MSEETRQGTDMEQDKTMANRGCQGCPYVRIMESKMRSKTVCYVVVCDHPDYEKMLGRLLVRRDIFDNRDEAEPPTRRPGFCPLEKRGGKSNGRKTDVEICERLR